MELDWWTTPSMVVVILLFFLVGLSNGAGSAESLAGLFGYAFGSFIGAAAMAGFCKLLGNAVLGLKPSRQSDDADVEG